MVSCNVIAGLLLNSDNDTCAWIPLTHARKSKIPEASGGSKCSVLLPTDFLILTSKPASELNRTGKPAPAVFIRPRRIQLSFWFINFLSVAPFDNNLVRLVSFLAILFYGRLISNPYAG